MGGTDSPCHCNDPLVIVMPPGTGKTTLAAAYRQFCKDHKIPLSAGAIWDIDEIRFNRFPSDSRLRGVCDSKFSVPSFGDNGNIARDCVDHCKGLIRPQDVLLSWCKPTTGPFWFFRRSDEWYTLVLQFDASKSKYPLHLWAKNQEQEYSSIADKNFDCVFNVYAHLEKHLGYEHNGLLALSLFGLSEVDAVDLVNSHTGVLALSNASGFL